MEPSRASTPRRAAGPRPSSATALRTLRPLARRRGVVVLVSDFLAGPDGPGPLYRELRAFAAHGHDVLVLQVRDPEEAELALPGSYRFVDPETGEERDAEVAT